MFIYQGKRINPEAQLTVGDTTYPNLNDPAIRQMLGIYEVPDPVYPDSELYTWAENVDGTLNIAGIPADVIAERNQLRLNQTSLAYLVETDWMVTRFAETGVTIPAEVKAARVAARLAIVIQKPEV